MNNDIKTIELIVNSSQAVSKLNEINAQLETARKKKLEAFEKGDAKGIQVYTSEIKKLERQAERMTTKAQTISSVLSSLDTATPKKIRQTLKALNDELNSGKVERGSKEWNILQENIKRCKAELEAIRNESKSAESSLLSASENFGKRWMGLTITLQGISSLFDRAMNISEKYVQDFAQMQEAEAEVIKYTGLTKDEVTELNEKFKTLDTRTPRERLNALAGDAGILGLTTKEAVLDFVDAANQIDVALGADLGEDAIKNIGKLADLFGETDKKGLKQAMLSTASTINVLGQSSSANEGYISDFTARLAGMAVQADISQAKVMSYASVLDQSMVSSEEAATALSSLIQKMYRDPALFAKSVGLDVNKFTKTLKTDANQALISFLTNLKKLGGMDKIAPVLSKLHITQAGAAKTVAALANNINRLEETQREATQAFEEGTSVTNEYNVANSTTQAELEKTQKALKDIRVEIGQRLNPMYQLGQNSLLLFFKALLKIIDIGAKYKHTILAIVAAIVIYQITLHKAILAQKASIAMDKIKIFWNQTLIASFKALWRTISLNPIGALLTVATVLVGVLWDISENAKKSAKELSEWAKISKQAQIESENEILKAKTLLEISRDKTKSDKERKVAIQQLNEINPTYLNGLTLETIHTNQATEAVNRYIQSLIKKKQIEKTSEKLSEYYDKLNNLPKIVQEQRNWWDKVVDGVDGFKKFLHKNLGGTLYEFNKYQNPIYGMLDTINTDNTSEYKKRENELRIEYQKKIQEGEKLLQQYIEEDNKLISSTETTPKGGGGGGGHTGTNNKKNKKEDLIKQLYEKKKLEARLQYEIGISSQREFNDMILALEEEKYQKISTLYKKGTKEYIDNENKRIEAHQKSIEAINAWSLADIEQQQNEEKNALYRQYAEGLIDEKEYQKQLNTITLKGLKTRYEYLKKFGTQEEMLKAKFAYEKEDDEQKIEKRKQLIEQLNALSQKYIEEKEATEEEDLRLAEDLAQKLSLTEENKEKLLFAIREKWRKKQEDKEKEEQQEKEKKYAALQLSNPTDTITNSFINLITLLSTLHQKLQSEGQASWEDYASVAVAAIGVVSSVMANASQLVQAQYKEEEQNIRERYDAEIAAVRYSSAKKRELEEQKSKAIAALKSKYAKKEAAMQIAQAIAQTAMNAILAYGSVVKIPIIGPTLAAIAAASAVAAGALQIAAIRKQAQIQEKGYYSGGFTGGSSYRKKAGIVHEGEFVANHQAVNNPHIYPFLRVIDHAQKNHTIASLTADDISRSVTAPQQVVQEIHIIRSSQDNSDVNEQTLDVLERLQQRIEKGTLAKVVITGEDGLEAKTNEYNRLKSIV